MNGRTIPTDVHGGRASHPAHRERGLALLAQWRHEDAATQTTHNPERKAG